MTRRVPPLAMDRWGFGMASRARKFSRGRVAGLALAGVSVAVMAQAAVQAGEITGEAKRTRGPAARTILAETPMAAEPVRLAIPKGSLESGLVAFTEQAGVKLVYPTALTARLETQGLAGEFAPIEALTRLLEGTGLTYRPAGASTITLVNPRYVQLGAEPAGAVQLDELHVQGQGQGRAAVAGLPPASGTVGQPPVPYAGGQVATGARLGALGNRSVLKTPFNVTSYTDKLIRDQQARTVGDVVLNDPSVRIDVPAFSERDSYFIRGFSVTNVDTAFDGLFYLTNARRHFVEGIERVEVLKGPTSLLSGGIGRVGGTINLIPKRAYDEPLTRITTTYISDAQIWTHADLGRRFGDFKEWGVRFNGAYRTGATALDKNEIEVGVATLGLDYRGERLRASLDLVHSNQNITAPVSIFNTVAPNIAIPRAPNGRINTASPFEYNDSSYGMAAGRVEYDLLPDTTLYAAGGISRYREDSLSSFYQITGPAGQATNSLAIAPIELQGLTGEIGLRSNFQTGIIGHQFTVSAVEAVNKNFSRGYVAPRFPTFQTNIYDPVSPPFGSISSFGFPRSSRQPLFNDLSVRSVAVADTLSLGGDRVLLTLGGRYQEINLKSFATRPGADFGSQVSGYTEGRISPVIALVVSPFDNLSFYGNYIEALEVGPTAPNTGAVDNPGQIFPPVVSTQKEVGAKYDFGTVAVTASLFEIQQPNAFTAGRLFTVNGLQRNRGVEFTAFGEPVPGVRLVGGVTFFDAQLARTAGGTFDGNAAPGVPDTAFNLYAEYDLPPWLAPGLTLTGRALYTSSVFFNQANTQSVPDWTRFDAGLRYTFEGVNGKPVVMRAVVENVFDNAYWASATRGFLAVGAPRTFIVSASVDF